MSVVQYDPRSRSETLPPSTGLTTTPVPAYSAKIQLEFISSKPEYVSRENSNDPPACISWGNEHIAGSNKCPIKKKNAKNKLRVKTPNKNYNAL